MEPPFTSFHPKNALEVGSQLIHPDFCKWLMRKPVFEKKMDMVLRYAHSSTDSLAGYADLTMADLPRLRAVE